MDLSLSSIPSIPVYNHTMQVNTTLNTMQVNKLTVIVRFIDVTQSLEKESLISQRVAFATV